MTDSFDSPDGRACSAPGTAGQAPATPGQAAYVAVATRDDSLWGPWPSLSDEGREIWEAAAQAAIAAAAPAPATPGQAAYEGMCTEAVRQGATIAPWSQLESWQRERWEAAAQAVIAAAAPAPAAAAFGQALWNGMPAACDTCGAPATTARYGPAAGTRPTFGCSEHPAITVTVAEPQPQAAPEPPRFAAEVRYEPCPVVGHDGKHMQWNTNGQWLCGHVLAASMALGGIPAEQAAPDPRLVPLDAAVLHREVRRLSELLGEIGVKAANAPEDGDSFAVLEEIAMMIAAMDVPDDGRHPDGCTCQFCREDEREERERADREELDDDTDSTIPDTEGGFW